MNQKIEIAIEKLAQDIINEAETGITEDYALKMSQAIVNLTNARRNLATN